MTSAPKTNSGSLKIVFLIVGLQLSIAIGFVFSILDFATIRFIEENDHSVHIFKTFMLVFSCFVLVLILIGHFRKNDSSSRERIFPKLIDSLLIFCFVVFIGTQPIKGLVLTTNRLIGQQEDVQVEGVVVYFRETFSRFDHGNRITIRDYYSGKLLTFRVKGNSKFAIGDRFEKKMKIGKWKIIYSKY